MSRNYQKNRYHPTPIERGSELESDFLADAKAHGMARFPGPFIAMRLADYYKAVKEGRLLPEGSSPSFVAGTHSSRMAPLPEREASVAVPTITARSEPEATVAVASRPAVAETITAVKGDGNFGFFFGDDLEDEDE